MTTKEASQNTHSRESFHPNVGNTVNTVNTANTVNTVDQLHFMLFTVNMVAGWTATIGSRR